MVWEQEKLQSNCSDTTSEEDEQYPLDEFKSNCLLLSTYVYILPQESSSTKLISRLHARKVMTADIAVTIDRPILVVTFSTSLRYRFALRA